MRKMFKGEFLQSSHYLAGLINIPIAHQMESYPQVPEMSASSKERVRPCKEQARDAFQCELTWNNPKLVP